MIPALSTWIESPLPGCNATSVVLRELGNRNFALTDPHRFDQDDVEAEGVHQRDGVGGSAGQPAKVTTARHRADEDRFVGEMLRQTDPIAEQRPVRER
jgi:hypothetical protein